MPRPVTVRGLVHHASAYRLGVVGGAMIGLLTWRAMVRHEHRRRVKRLERKVDKVAEATGASE